MVSIAQLILFETYVLHYNHGGHFKQIHQKKETQDQNKINDFYGSKDEGYDVTTNTNFR